MGDVEMKKKGDLDAQVSQVALLNKRDVSKVTTLFLAALAEALANGHPVHLEGLGRLRCVRMAPPSSPQTLRIGNFKKGETTGAVTVRPVRYRVSFSQAVPFKKLIRERAAGRNELMEKYAVDEGVEDDETLEKQAAQGCPACGAKPVRHGRRLMCPTHGTEPFEKKQ